MLPACTGLGSSALACFWPAHPSPCSFDAFGLPTHLLALSACNGLSSAAVACFLPVLVLYLEPLHATR